MSLSGMVKSVRSTLGAHQEPSKTRQRILDAALKAFSVHGYTGASTREIARLAGVHQPVIAYYFQNKEQLWRAAVDAVFGDFQAAMAPVWLDQREPDERLRRLVETFIRYVAQKPEWAALLVHEGLQSNERNDWMIDTWVTPHTRDLYRAMTGRTFPKRAHAMAQAMSTVVLLTGSAVTFAQQVQVLRVSGIDTASERFIAIHIETVLTALKALADPAPAQGPGRRS